MTEKYVESRMDFIRRFCFCSKYSGKPGVRQDLVHVFRRLLRVMGDVRIGKSDSQALFQKVP